MDTIKNKTDELLKNKGQGGKKADIGDKVRAGIIGSAAGVAAGAAAMSLSTPEDAEIPTDNPILDSEDVQEAVLPEESSLEEMAEVDPEDVMLEAPSEENEVAVEIHSRTDLEGEYQPFANNDEIDVIDGMPSSVPDDELFADILEIDGDDFEEDAIYYGEELEASSSSSPLSEEGIAASTNESESETLTGVDPVPDAEIQSDLFG